MNEDYDRKILFIIIYTCLYLTDYDDLDDVLGDLLAEDGMF